MPLERTFDDHPPTIATHVDLRRPLERSARHRDRVAVARLAAAGERALIEALGTLHQAGLFGFADRRAHRPGRAPEMLGEPAQRRERRLVAGRELDQEQHDYARTLAQPGMLCGDPSEPLYGAENPRSFVGPGCRSLIFSVRLGKSLPTEYGLGIVHFVTALQALFLLAAKQKEVQGFGI